MKTYSVYYKDGSKTVQWSGRTHHTLEAAKKELEAGRKYAPSKSVKNSFEIKSNSKDNKKSSLFGNFDNQFRWP